LESQRFVFVVASKKGLSWATQLSAKYRVIVNADFDSDDCLQPVSFFTYEDALLHAVDIARAFEGRATAPTIWVDPPEKDYCCSWTVEQLLAMGLMIFASQICDD
jgi:hypothetical protein